jgi:beta-glucanase (GH16 family)
MQYYALQRKENSRVENGKLIIEARHESAEDFEDSMMQEYTSARLITRGRVSWTYGYFEIRAKIPCGQGLWPAIWMLGESADRRWPRNGEIDIMEHINSESGVHFSFHTDAHNHVARTQVTTTRNETLCDGSFHTYQVHWTPKEVKIGMDGSYDLTYPNEGKGIEQWPFESPQYLILNVAVGGDWPGKPNESTVFPARMEVDYVRVYQAK